MHKALYSGVLMTSGVLTSILLMTTMQIYADKIEIDNDQKNSVSGIKPNSQNCTQINLDARNTAGDEGVDCHNQREENNNQTASD
jgi:hypothetical protein